MSLSTQPYKGARDFYPEDMRLQKYIFSKWREICEAFGYEEYDAPILEPTELYLSKGNEEIIKEQTYTFTDRGKRSVTLRTEMTPTVSRMVAAKRQELPYPLRWYSMPQCWRYERMQRGRGREFYQLNVDMFGIDALAADQEMIEMSDAIMKAFGANADMYRIEISSRRVLNELAEKAGIQDTAAFIRLVDAKEKISSEEFKKKLSSLTRDKDGLELALYVLNLKSLESIRTGLNFESLDAVRELIVNLEQKLISGPKTNILFNPATARGFEYYTDIVFEVFDNNPDNNRSMFGGGRYDGLVSLFGVEAVPSVGFAMGDITLRNFLETHQLVPQLKSETDLYVALIGDTAGPVQAVVDQLRQAGLNVAVDYSGKKPDKQIKSALKKGINYLLFVGEKELGSGKFTLKDLNANKETTVAVEDVSKIVKA